MNSEMVGEAMDIGDANNEEADAVYDQIMGEIGMDINMGTAIGQNGIVNPNANANALPPEEAKTNEVDDLEARLMQL